MYKTIEFNIKSISPLLMHNGRLADPNYEFTKAMKPIQAKRKKTEDDFERLSELEFLGSLYTEAEKIVIPSDVIYATMIAGAKKQRKGVEAKSGIFCDGNFPIIYDGPKDPLKLYRHGGFTDVRRVVIGKASIMRTRPIFRDWQLKFSISYDPSILNESQIVNFVEDAGSVVGMCDYRPRFGRFQIAS